MFDKLWNLKNVYYFCEQQYRLLYFFFDIRSVVLHSCSRKLGNFSTTLKNGIQFHASCFVPLIANRNYRLKLLLMRFRIVLVSLLMMFNFCKVIHAERVELDGIFYDLSDEAKTAEVSGYSDAIQAVVNIPSKISFNGDLYDVVSLRYNVFRNCRIITHVKIPYSVTAIGNDAFTQCFSLQNIEVDNENQMYSSIDGVLFDKGKKKLVCYPAGKEGEYIIPYGVETVGFAAFSGCLNLTSIIFSESVTCIEDYAFYICRGLKNVILSENLKSIGMMAFYNSYSLVSLELPSKLEEIGSGAFMECEKLYEIFNKSALNIVEQSDDYGNVALYAQNVYTEEGYSKLKMLGDFLFYIEDNDVTLLTYTGQDTSIKLPESVNGYSYEIANYAFAAPILLSDMEMIDIWQPKSNVSELVEIVISEGVNSIGKYAFKSCTNLMKITIPKSVGNVGEFAFQDCTNLLSVTIEEGVASIENYAFAGCYHLYEIFNKSSLDIVVGSSDNGGIAYYAKNVCSKEEDSKIKGLDDCFFFVDGNNIELLIYFGENIDVILPNTIDGHTYMVANDAFYNRIDIVSINLGDGVTSIGERAFSGCKSLTNVTLGKNIRSIGSDAFLGCDGLQYVNYTGSVSDWCGISFGNYLSNPFSIVGNFYVGGDEVLKLVIPEEVEVIKEYAFSNIVGLKEVEVRANILTIESYVFSGCENLERITLPKSLKTINYYAFLDCVSLKSITLPANVTNIANEAFTGCVSLKDLRFEDGTEILTIGNKFGDLMNYPIFADCPLESVYIGRDLSFDTSKDAGYSPFNNQSGLSTVIIGENVTKLENYLLYNCSGIEKIISFSTTPPKASRLTFRGVNTDICSVTVPIGSLADYTSAAYWKSFFNVVEADLSGVGSIQTNNLKPVYYNLNGQRVLNPSEGIYIQNGRKVYIR